MQSTVHKRIQPNNRRVLSTTLFALFCLLSAGPVFAQELSNNSTVFHSPISVVHITGILFWVTLSVFLGYTILLIGLWRARGRQKIEAGIILENQKKLKILYDESPDMYVSVSPKDGKILRCNHTLMDKLGYSKAEIEGTQIFSLYHEDCLEEVRKLFQQFVETGVVKDRRLTLRKKDGHKLEVSLNSSAIRDETGQILYSISCWRVITERLEAEKQLRESELKFRALFEQAGGYCMILDPNTSDGIPIIIDANEAACSMHGYTRDEFIGRPVADIDDEEGKRLVKKRTKEILTGEPFSVENTHVRQDGSTFIVAVNAQRIDIGNKPPIIFSTEYNISKRKEAESELIQHRDNLDQLVKEKTESLQKTLNCMVDRELRMRELKKSNSKLEQQVRDLGYEPNV